MQRSIRRFCYHLWRIAGVTSQEAAKAGWWRLGFVTAIKRWSDGRSIFSKLLWFGVYPTILIVAAQEVGDSYLFRFVVKSTFTLWPFSGLDDIDMLLPHLRGETYILSHQFTLSATKYLHFLGGTARFGTNSNISASAFERPVHFAGFHKIHRVSAKSIDSAGLSFCNSKPDAPYERRYIVPLFEISKTCIII